MAKFTAYAMASWVRETPETEKWQCKVIFGRYVDEEAAIADLERKSGEVFPRDVFTERWTSLTRLPREFFEEVLASIGDLRDLSDLNDPRKETVLDDEFLFSD